MTFNEEKAKILADWDRAKSDFARKNDAGQILDDDLIGGVGYPDPEIYQLCDRLNALPGIVTVQSCAGHRRVDLTDGEASLWSGQIWVKLSPGIRYRYTDYMPEVLALAGIERVGLLYIPGYEYVADVQFDGMNRGVISLMESVDGILRFFEYLTRNFES